MTVALCCLPAVSIAASDDPKELERLLAQVRSEPMVFIVATGEPNACGRGCTEWIAGEGRFDEGAAQRFREFLTALAKRERNCPHVQRSSNVAEWRTDDDQAVR